MKKAVVIGHFDWTGNNMIGAVVKARNIYEELQHQLGVEQVGCVDIYEWRKRKAFVLLEIVKVFACYRNIILVCSDTSVNLMRLFTLLKTVFRNEIHYCVVGGDIAELLAQHPEQQGQLKCIDNFYVETEDCADGMQRLGIKNTCLLKNFKRIQPLSEPIEYAEDVYRFCTFSRVTEKKGITEAIRAVELINREIGYEKCKLDIYGQVDPAYRSRFKSLLENSKSVKYKGVVDSKDSVNILKNYYCLLFPTKYQSEGIPGTLIDGFAAGLPVICSNWVRCSQIIKDGENGLVYPFGDFEAFTNTIRNAIDDANHLKALRKGSLSTFEAYRPEVAIKPLLDKMS